MSHSSVRELTGAPLSPSRRILLHYSRSVLGRGPGKRRPHRERVLLRLHLLYVQSNGDDLPLTPHRRDRRPIFHELMRCTRSASDVSRPCRSATCAFRGSYPSISRGSAAIAGTVPSPDCPSQGPAPSQLGASFVTFSRIPSHVADASVGWLNPSRASISGPLRGMASHRSRTFSCVVNASRISVSQSQPLDLMRVGCLTGSGVPDAPVHGK